MANAWPMLKRCWENGDRYMPVGSNTLAIAAEPIWLVEYESGGSLVLVGIKDDIQGMWNDFR